MNTKKKPAPGGNRETGYYTAFDGREHSPIHASLKAMLLALAAYDAAVLALLVLVAFAAAEVMV